MGVSSASDLLLVGDICLNADPGGDLVLPVEVDFSQPFPAAAQAAWEQEYHQAVQLEQLVTWEPRPERRLSCARSLVDCGDQGRSTDPYLDDPFWDDQQFRLFRLTHAQL